jgi:hypothetical protein
LKIKKNYQYAIQHGKHDELGPTILPFFKTQDRTKPPHRANNQGKNILCINIQQAQNQTTMDGNGQKTTINARIAEKPIGNVDATTDIKMTQMMRLWWN